MNNNIKHPPPSYTGHHDEGYEFDGADIFFILTALILFIVSVISLITLGGKQSIPTIISIIGILMSIFSYISRKELKNNRETRIRSITTNLAISIAISIFVAGLSQGLIAAYQKISIPDSWKYYILASVLAFMAGTFLYIFRRKYRTTWGATEVAVGILIVVYRSSEKSSAIDGINVEYFIGIITAGLYLIVRGLDNIEQGMEKKGKLKQNSSEQLHL